MRKTCKALFSLFFTILLTVMLLPTVTQAAANYKVIGYVYGTPSYVDVAKLTHVNYAFGYIVNGQVSISNPSDLTRMVAFKAVNPNLKVVLSVGGWGADGFSDAALSEASRNTFANSCLNVINTYKLDGIDLDWEYPVNGGWGVIKCRPEDKQNYTLMLQAVRNKIGAGKILSIAAGADQSFVNNTEMSKIAGICDYINLMTYDFAHDKHNANLYPTNSGFGSGLSCDQSVNIFINAGVPAAKLNLGLPFYGYYGSQYLSYGTLVQNYVNKNGWVRYWDDAAKAAYLRNGSSFITYEDEQSVGFKTDYIKAKGLGGAMFWEYNQDYNGSLLNKLWSGLGTGTVTPPVTDKWSGIKAVANGYYVSADNYGNSPLIANREVVEDWERFQVIDNGDGTISLLSKSNGRYVCADLNQDAKLIARSETIQGWEKFKKVILADGTVALQAMANNNYVSADLNQGGVLYANRPAVGGAWEAFVITEN